MNLSFAVTSYYIDLMRYTVYSYHSPKPFMMQVAQRELVQRISLSFTLFVLFRRQRGAARSCQQCRPATRGKERSPTQLKLKCRRRICRRCHSRLAASFVCTGRLGQHQDNRSLRLISPGHAAMKHCSTVNPFRRMKGQQPAARDDIAVFLSRLDSKKSREQWQRVQGIARHAVASSLTVVSALSASCNGESLRRCFAASLPGISCQVGT